MSKDDRKQLAGILKQFDQETIKAVITDLDIMTPSQTSFHTPGIYFVPPTLIASGGVSIDAGDRKSTDCGPLSVTITKDSEPFVASNPTSETSADTDARKKARDAAQSSCKTNGCKESSQKCKYTENSITLTTRRETQTISNQPTKVIISTATTKGACRCE